MGRATRWFRSLLGGNKAAEDRPAKRKKGWGFVKTFQKDRLLPTTVAVSGDEQRMRAIAVAAATAVAAEAAVEAAEAAAAVVRLTTSGWPAGLKMEELAAVKVQAAFRGYLARRALRALKGLVKLQALVRGNIVRKQAAETLRCMKALVRVQTRARAFRALHSEQSRPSKSCHHSYNGPATPENYEAAIRSIASKWMEEPYLSRREASKSMDDEKNSRIFELENEKSRFYSRRGSSLYHLQSDQSAGSVTTVPDSLSKESNTPTHLSTPSASPFDGHQYTSQPLRFPAVESGDSPRLYSTVSQSGSSRRGPFTPAKSEFSRSLFEGYPNHPSYMAKTESSIAKLRSRSAPRQRPECEKTKSMRRLPAQELGHQASRSSKLQGKGYPGSGRLDRLGMPMAM